MQNPPLYASAMFASRNLRLASQSKTGELLRALEACCSPHHLASFFTVTASGGMSRSKAIDDHEQLERTWLRSTTAEVHLASNAAGQRANLEAFAWATLERHPVPYVRAEGENFLQRATLHRSLAATETVAFVDALRALFELLDAPCGYLLVSTDHGLALSELGFERIMGRRPPEATQPDGPSTPDVSGSIIRYHHPEDTNDRVEQLVEVRSLVGPRLRGTYWGTFIGREMVDELGGADRVRREAPVHLVEPFGDGALCLQLTPVPEPITTPAMQSGLLALEQFLQPVLVPLPPYWATRAAKAAQRAAASGGTTNPA
jgi:hypothetical protein